VIANAIRRLAIVVKLDDDIGFAIAIGAAIELLIELVMLPELGRTFRSRPGRIRSRSGRRSAVLGLGWGRDDSEESSEEADR
jgi:hypothetical protein